MINRAQILQSILDYSDYELDPTGTRCQRYIASVRRLIFVTCQSEQIGGESGLTKSYDLATLNSMLNTALKYLSTTSQYGSGQETETIQMAGIYDGRF